MGSYSGRVRDRDRIGVRPQPPREESAEDDPEREREIPGALAAPVVVEERGAPGPAFREERGARVAQVARNPEHAIAQEEQRGRREPE